MHNPSLCFICTSKFKACITCIGALRAINIFNTYTQTHTRISFDDKAKFIVTCSPTLVGWVGVQVCNMYSK